jgi:hypothetical protein
VGFLEERPNLAQERGVVVDDQHTRHGQMLTAPRGLANQG